MDLSLMFIYISFTFLFLISYYYMFQSKKSENPTTETPPGSTGWPLIGETMAYLSAGKKGIHESFVIKRMKKYATNTFKTSLVGETMVILCSAEGNKFLFSNESKLVKAWWPRTVDTIFGTPDAAHNGDEALKLRRFLLPFLKPDALQKYVEIMDRVTKQHVESYWKDKEIVKVHQLAKKYTFSLACRLFVGIEDPKKIAEIEEPFGLLTGAIVSLPINIPGTNFNRAIKAGKELRLEIEAMVKSWKSRLSEEKTLQVKSLLTELLQDAFNSGTFTDDADITNKILAALTGAYDSASATLASIMMLLAEMPEVYDGVWREQMKIARSKGPEELLNWEDIKKMKYSWNVICEVLRLHPPVTGTFREAITDFTYDGFLIPKGWKLMWNAYATHKNPQYFENPLKFDPSRFEGEGPAPFSYIPFGGGPRLCPGLEYARVKMLVFIHNMVTRFKWEKVFPNEKIISDPLLKPEKGLPIRLYPHKF